MKKNINAKYVIVFSSSMSQGTHLTFLDLSQQTPDCIPVPFLNWLVNMNLYVTGILQYMWQISQQICSTEFFLLE